MIVPDFRVGRLFTPKAFFRDLTTHRGPDMIHNYL